MGILQVYLLLSMGMWKELRIFLPGLSLSHKISWTFQRLSSCPGFKVHSLNRVNENISKGRDYGTNILHSVPSIVHSIHPQTSAWNFFVFQNVTEQNMVIWISMAHIFCILWSVVHRYIIITDSKRAGQVKYTIYPNYCNQYTGYNFYLILSVQNLHSITSYVRSLKC